jgi:hypothetical protein
MRRSLGWLSPLYRDLLFGLGRSSERIKVGPWSKYNPHSATSFSRYMGGQKTPDSMA